MLIFRIIINKKSLLEYQHHPIHDYNIALHLVEKHIFLNHQHISVVEQLKLVWLLFAFLCVVLRFGHRWVEHDIVDYQLNKNT